MARGNVRSGYFRKITKEESVELDLPSNCVKFTTTASDERVYSWLHPESALPTILFHNDPVRNRLKRLRELNEMQPTAAETYALLRAALKSVVNAERAALYKEREADWTLMVREAREQHEKDIRHRDALDRITMEAWRRDAKDELIAQAWNEPNEERKAHLLAGRLPQAPIHDTTYEEASALWRCKLRCRAARREVRLQKGQPNTLDFLRFGDARGERMKKDAQAKAEAERQNEERAALQRMRLLLSPNNDVRLKDLVATKPAASKPKPTKKDAPKRPRMSAEEARLRAKYPRPEEKQFWSRGQGSRR